MNEELREAGMVGVGDLARRFDMSADLMSKALTERMGSIVRGRMEGALLYTPGYVARLTAQLRGAMRAALTPTTRDALVTNALVAETPAGAELTGSIIQDLAKSGVADGVFRGGAWHPSVYSRAQTAAVADVYARAGLCTMDDAKRMAGPGEYFLPLRSLTPLGCLTSPGGPGPDPSLPRTCIRTVRSQGGRPRRRFRFLS